MNIIRGGWLQLPGKTIWPLAHLILWLWMGGCSILVAIGQRVAITWGWGVYQGAILNGYYDEPEPQSEIKWIDRIIWPLRGKPVLYGLAGCFLRGLMGSACISILLIPCVYFGEATWLLGSLGFSTMPIAFYLARFWPHAPRVAEGIWGAMQGLAWYLVL